jgi:hypothetical protein
MSLPPSFSGMPAEEQHHYYRNVCIEFKKAVKSKKDVNILRERMDDFLNASRAMAWPHKTSGVYHKDEVEKNMQKVVNEFRRYIHDLENNRPNANPVDLLNALGNVESMIDQLKVR